MSRLINPLAAAALLVVLVANSALAVPQEKLSSGAVQSASLSGPNVRVTTADLLPTTCGAQPCDPYAAPSGPTDVMQQNEPSIAQSPNHPNLLAVGVNDLNTFSLTGEAWMGLRLSIDGGATWPDAMQRLVPGFPGDSSAAGRASPIFGNDAAGDPALAFDDQYLYLAFIPFHRTQIHPASDKDTLNAVAVARYWVRADGSGVDYDTTFVVQRGTNGFGRQMDKEWITVDPATGDLYVTYARFNGSTNTLEFKKSSDQARSWSAPIRIDESTRSTFYGSIAVGPKSTVYVAYRSFVPALNLKTQGGPRQDAIYLVRSDDGGISFSKPMLVDFINPFDWDRIDTPPAFRTSSQPSIAVSSNGTIWLAFDAKNSPTSGDDVNVVCSSTEGASWSARKNPHSLAAALGATGNGHQLMPSATVVGDTLSLIWYDSRSEPSFTPNGRVTSTGSTGFGPGMDVYYNQLDASSCVSDFAAEVRLTSQSFNPNTRGSNSATLGFIGDYIQVVADQTNAYAVWTDNRDVTVQSICEDADPATNDTACINNRSRDSNVYFQKVVK